MYSKKRLFKVSGLSTLFHFASRSASNFASCSTSRSILYPIKLFLYLCSFLLIGCSLSMLHLDISAAHQLNRDTHFHSLPVVVRVYTLKSPDGFSDGTFRELWHNDKKILGDNLVSRQEFSVIPGKSLHLSLMKNNGANYLGVIALFRHPEHNQWRALIPLPLFSASLTLSGNHIALS